MITPAQCRGARAMLGLNRKDLADRAKVAERTIVDFERGARQTYARTLEDIERALENEGIEFIEEDDSNGAGVRLCKKK